MGRHPDDRPNDEGQEGHPDIRPYFCIPYWSAAVAGVADPWDTGQTRPIPAAVCPYLCDAIHAGPYVPGQRLDVTVSVRNTGGGNSASIATVVVYWADPTVGFAKPAFLAATAIAVPTTRTTPGSTTTPTLSGIIPATAPNHICLLVSVSHPQDRAGTVLDPYHDRHWAQRNLNAVAAAVGAPAIMPFMAANPFAQEAELTLRAGFADERHLEPVARAVNAQPAFVAPRLRLLDTAGSGLSEAGRRVETTISLGPLEQRPFQLLIEIDEEIPPGASSAIEIELIDQRNERGPVGSLGVALIPPSDA